MAIGGMIGGGIFSVLGVTVDLAGHLAFGCFVLGGVIALITARSYAVLSLRAVDRVARSSTFTISAAPSSVRSSRGC